MSVWEEGMGERADVCGGTENLPLISDSVTGVESSDMSL